MRSGYISVSVALQSRMLLQRPSNGDGFQGKGKGSEQENGDEGGKGWGGLKMLLVHER